MFFTVSLLLKMHFDKKVKKDSLFLFNISNTVILSHESQSNKSYSNFGNFDRNSKQKVHLNEQQTPHHDMNRTRRTRQCSKTPTLPERLSVRPRHFRHILDEHKNSSSDALATPDMVWKNTPGADVPLGPLDITPQTKTRWYPIDWITIWMMNACQCHWSSVSGLHCTNIQSLAPSCVLPALGSHAGRRTNWRGSSSSWDGMPYDTHTWISIGFS